MNKRIAAFLAACMLLVGIVSAGLADTSDTITIEPSIFSGLEVSAERWMANAENRALFTVFAVLQVEQAAGNMDGGMALTNPSVVGCSENMMFLDCFDGHDIYIIVVEGDGSMSYATFDGSGLTPEKAAEMMEAAIQKNSWAYERNTEEAIMTALGEALEILNPS